MSDGIYRHPARSTRPRAALAACGPMFATFGRKAGNPTAAIGPHIGPKPSRTQSGNLRKWIRRRSLRDSRTAHLGANARRNPCQPLRRLERIALLLVVVLHGLGVLGLLGLLLKRASADLSVSPL